MTGSQSGDRQLRQTQDMMKADVAMIQAYAVQAWGEFFGIFEGVSFNSYSLIAIPYFGATLLSMEQAVTDSNT